MLHKAPTSSQGPGKRHLHARPRRAVRIVIGGTVTATLMGWAPIAPASADDLSSGTWYFDKGHVQEALDAGFTGKGVKIAVIDTQINPATPTLQGANVTPVGKTYCYDEQGKPVPAISTDFAGAKHGTHVVSLIVGTGKTTPGQIPIRGVAPQAEVLFYNSGLATSAKQSLTCRDSAGKDYSDESLAQAMNDAMDAHADIISVSLGGRYSASTNRALARALALGIPVVAGLTNDPLAAVGEFPAAGNGSVAVQAIDATSTVQKAGGFSNRSLSVKVAAPGVGIITQGTAESWNAQVLGNGTSLATPIVAGFLADMKSKFPKATGNQLLQTMIRNTGGTHHEPQWGDDRGYGTISLTQMRTDNPLAYPDVNPFFNPKATTSEGPTAEDVQQAGRSQPVPQAPEATTTPAKAEQPTHEPSATASKTGQPTAAPSPLTWVPWTVGAFVLLIILGIVLVRSRGRKSNTRSAVDTETSADSAPGAGRK